jgi:hypothetical protein
LASCLLDEPDTVDLPPYRADFDAAVAQIDRLRGKSEVLLGVYYVSLFVTHRVNIANGLYSYCKALLSEQSHLSEMMNMDFESDFDDCIDGVQWMNPESIDWVKSPSFFFLSFSFFILKVSVCNVNSEMASTGKTF